VAFAEQHWWVCVPGPVVERVKLLRAKMDSSLLRWRAGKAMGVGGLVHTSELSWDQVMSVASAVSVGQRIKVKILKVDK